MEYSHTLDQYARCWRELLTPATAQVFALNAAGLSVPSMARALVVSPRTIEGNLTRLWRIVGVECDGLLPKRALVARFWMHCGCCTASLVHSLQHAASDSGMSPGRGALESILAQHLPAAWSNCTQVLQPYALGFSASRIASDQNLSGPTVARRIALARSELPRFRGRPASPAVAIWVHRPCCPLWVAQS